jgi:hypothetical protein
MLKKPCMVKPLLQQRRQTPFPLANDKKSRQNKTIMIRALHAP